MSKRIKKRIRQQMEAGLQLYKQTVWNEVDRHSGHLDDDDYQEVMQIYIEILTRDLANAELALNIMEEHL